MINILIHLLKYTYIYCHQGSFYFVYRYDICDIFSDYGEIVDTKTS